jgi:hypothetical protein
MIHSSGGFFMSRILRFFVLLFPFALTGCIANNLADNITLPITSTTVAQHKFDTTHVYWYSSRQKQPERLGERVYNSQQGNYQSDYQWLSGNLYELQQRGYKNIDGELVSFRLQLRFDSQGLAVFQRYEENEHVLPLNMAEISALQLQGEQLLDRIYQLEKKGQFFVQGYWRDHQFISCSNQQALIVHQSLLEQALPQVGYLAAIGQVQQNDFTIAHALFQIESKICLQAPSLIKTDNVRLK